MNKQYLSGLLAAVMAFGFIFTGCDMLNSEDLKKAVNNVPVTGISVSPSTVEVPMEGTATVSADVEPSGATNKDVTWTVSDTSIITLSGSGSSRTITPVKMGSAKITVKSGDGGFTDTCEVTVKAAIPVTSLTISPDKEELQVGSTKQLSVSVAPSDASNKVTWSSDAKDVADVSATGLVTALKLGTAKITAVSQITTDKKATYEVEVVQSTGGGNSAGGGAAVTHIEISKKGDNSTGSNSSNTGSSTGGGTGSTTDDGSELTKALDMGEVTVGYTTEVTITLSPVIPAPANSNVRWVDYGSNFAKITKSDKNGATIQGITKSGGNHAIFSVQSVSNPEVIVYFKVKVIGTVAVEKFCDNGLKVIEDNIEELDPMKLSKPTFKNSYSGNTDNDGSADDKYLTLGAKDGYDKVYLKTKLVGENSKVPTNLSVYFDIKPSGAAKLETVKKNTSTGEVWFKLTALKSTGNEANQLAQITAIAGEKSTIKSKVFYLRVLEPWSSNTSSSLKFKEIQNAVANLTSLTINASSTKEIYVISTSPPTEDLTFTWEVGSNSSSYISSVNPSSSSSTTTTTNPKNKATITAGSTATSGNTSASVKVTVKDYFDTSGTAPSATLSNIKVVSASP